MFELKKTMRGNFTRASTLTVALTLSLLALDQLPGRLPPDFPLSIRIGRMVREMHNGDLNAEDLHVAAGYYEELRNDVPITGLGQGSDIRPAAGFLRFEYRPHVKRSYPAGMRITNSFGMANPEYSPEKPPHTRRIALLGPSISVGPYGHDYPALLEQRLNQDCRTPEIQGFQVLNFSVFGYSVVQEMDVALEKASKFHPDVYLVAVTSLELAGQNGSRIHVARLMREGADLKYDYLRKVVAESGARPSDRLAIINAKLAPFLTPMMRWALGRIRDHAISEGAEMIIHLVPIPGTPEVQAKDFESLHKGVDGIGVPVLDLLNAFGSANLSEIEVVPWEKARDGVAPDHHPNALGHEMIFHSLYASLQANHNAWVAMTGSDCGKPGR
jgi:hypothetical protein